MMGRVQDSVETVNAAAAAIVSAAAQSRGQQQEEQHVTPTRKRWWSRLSAHWCFRPHGDGRRIADANLVGEPAYRESNAPTSTNPNHHAPPPAMPFVAPPSSPASSLLTSEAPSVTQSPAAPLILSASSYSPRGPASIFAIGPYAHEPQLVSPPVFSTFTTEPSTAPFTPPPESLHLTNPSSPEVPFARLLASSFNANNCEKSHEGNEFHSYQLQPGSPIGQLVSPGSVCSSSSSPFPDLECQSRSGGGIFQITEPPRILGPEEIASRKLNRRYARNDGSLLDGHIMAAVPAVESTLVSENGGRANRRVSFELAAEEAACSSSSTNVAVSAEAVTQASRQVAGPDEANITNGGSKICVDETYHDLPKKVEPAVRRQESKEFMFDNADGAAAAEQNVASDWFANEAGAPTEAETSRKNWPFFPMIEHGMS